MTVSFASAPTNYLDALAFLNGKSSRKLAHNTIMHQTHDGNIHIQYHATNIITYKASGIVQFTTGGWDTTTTTQRLNLIASRMGFRIFIRQGVALYTRNGDTELLAPFLTVPEV